MSHIKKVKCRTSKNRKEKNSIDMLNFTPSFQLDCIINHEAQNNEGLVKLAKAEIAGRAVIAAYVKMTGKHLSFEDMNINRKYILEEIDRFGHDLKMVEIFDNFFLIDGNYTRFFYNRSYPFISALQRSFFIRYILYIFITLHIWS